MLRDRTGAGFAPDFAWRRRIDGDTVLGAFRHVSTITRASFAEFLNFLPALSHARGLLTLRFGGDFFNSLRLPTRWSGDDITPFERNRLLAATPLMSELELRLANLRAAFPAFKAAEYRESWGGIIDATPDLTPVISAIDDRPGLFLISLSGSGLTSGPAAGEMLAQIIAGEKPGLDPSIYRYARFFDGTKLIFRH